jgi:NAD(P)-dependent dehydrogenase (short-subunit alcohol dehydrogenase family)
MFAEAERAFGRLDVLVNNAGGVFPKRVDSKDGLEATFALNVMAPFVLTQELRDLLKASGGRVINLATRIPPGTKVKLDDVQGISGGYSGMGAYGRSKLVVIMLTRELAKRLQPEGITVNSVHPGIILETNFSNNMGLPPLVQKIGNLVGKLISVSMEQGIASQLYLAGSPEAKGVTGKYFMKMKPAKEPSSALDDATCQGVYAAVEKLSGSAQGGARAKTGS